MDIKQKVKNYVGIDVSKKQLEVLRFRENERHERFRTGTNSKGIRELLQWLKPDDIVILEAGGQTFRIAKEIIKGGYEAIVLNPGDVATIYNSLKKTDSEDTLKLARLAHRNPREELPEVMIPTDEEEDARRLATEQSYWSRQQTSGKNRLHSLFTQAGLTDITKSHLRSCKGREEAIRLLPERYQDEAQRLTKCLEMIDNHLHEIARETKEQLNKNMAYTELAMSIPGIGPVTTLAFLAYLGECKRFSSGKQVSYYTGLVPRVEQSGDYVRYGKIIKRGCTPIRRVIIQCAWALVKSQHGGELKEFYNRLYARIGKKKAIVAVARKMVEVFYAMIKSGELYRFTPADVLEQKLRIYGLT